ncbi:MAG TPA: hypothetical protein VH394_07560 [Thermoanaerobaculia bacterium]|jgi:hypothetical protein|nr:hypothetical protein [Thermoanaerobaculia bacterium]
MSYRPALCAAVLALVALQGCGKQGNPEPPFRTVPAKTGDLKVRQQDGRLLLDFTFPQTTAAGTALGGLSSIEVWESVQPAPRTGKPAPIDARVFESASALKLTIGQQDLPAVTFGSRVLIPIPVTLPEPAAPPPTPTPTPTPEATATPTTTPAVPANPPNAKAYFYAVRTVSATGEKSDFSNQVAIIPGTPPAAPERLSVTGRPDGVLVEWSGTAGATGYNVYRRSADERSLGQPIHTAAAGERSWVDTGARMGQSYIYGVTALAGQDPLIESSVASEQEIRFQDRFPPPPPLELVALAEGGRVRLIWRASEAEDLAGYHVYRRGAEGDFQRITTQPLQETEYIDTLASAGQTYSYRVTAVDQIGNESGPGAEVRASVPQ